MSFLTKSVLYCFLIFSALSAMASTKAVFAHYMISGITADHADTDVTQAQALGFDAFAVNVQTPSASWTVQAVQQLFHVAESKGFKLFLSLDFDAHSDWQDFSGMLQQYLGSPAYYKAGPDSLPLVSTFGAGQMGPSDLAAFKSAFDGQMYFAPAADLTQGYYTDPDAWFESWNHVVDGTFSWNAAWPWSCSTDPNNLDWASDQAVHDAANNNSKAYIMGLSPLQYKRLDSNNHFYRAGEDVLPGRMADILSLGHLSGTIAPDFVEYISWNDAGESHYLGAVWPESIPPGSPAAAYSAFDHSAWQPLIASFITAYKAGAQACDMAPPSGASAIGAMWYRPILKSAHCAGDEFGKPEGWQGARDSVNFAVIVPSAAAAGAKIIVSSGGSVLKTIDASPGLNWAAVDGLATGAQKVELQDASGKVVLSASSAQDVTADSPDGVCNFNYVVVGMQ